MQTLSQLRGEVRLEQIRITPNPEVQGRGGSAPDVTLQNAGPVVFDVTRTGADIREAHFTATDTQMEAQGHIGFGAKIRGTSRSPGPSICASCSCSTPICWPPGTPRCRRDSRVAGRPAGERPPRVAERVLYLADLPNGVDKANGVILFDRTRATIQRADRGERRRAHLLYRFRGFGAPLLTYRVAARADGVRYRSPQGASLPWTPRSI